MPRARQARLKTKLRSPEERFGAVLRRLRATRSISQEELAYKSGYHRTYIGQMERAEKSPSLRTLFNIAGALGVKASEILRAVENEL
jgi:transcriptional regulator with XRE-family HTH domain